MKEVAPVCRKSFFSPVNMKFYQRPLTSPVLNVFASNASAKLHTSSQCQRRQRWEESPLRALLRNQWQEIRKTPKPAFVIACAGSIPLVTVPLVMSAAHMYLPILATAQVMYGACTLSFFGGVRWGITLLDNSLARPNWINLTTGVLYPYLAFMSLLYFEDGQSAMIGLGIGFVVSLIIDITGKMTEDMSPITPAWYLWIRFLLTVVALLSLVATAVCAEVYPLYKIEETAPSEK